MLMLSCSIASYGQTDSMVQKNDSINNIALNEYNPKLGEVEKLRVADSIKIFYSPYSIPLGNAL